MRTRERDDDTVREETQARDRVGARPPRVVDDVALAACAPSFSEYMARALFDARFGYYTTGEVRFGFEAHFETFPQRLRPLFGRMVAEAAGAALAELVASGQVPDDAALTILELGAGNGDLAGDALDWIVSQRHRAPFDAIVERVRYTIGELSPALRERQSARLAEHIAAGRAAVEAVDARTLDWSGPFYGVLVANELIDAFPCEQLRIEAPDRVLRVHTLAVAPTDAVAPDLRAPEALSSAWRARLGRDDVVVLSPGGLWAVLAEAAAAGAQAPVELIELGVPLSHGWLDEAGRVGPVPAMLTEHLARVAPMVADLEALELLPTTLCWPTALPDFVAAMRGLLTGPERLGHALLVDYGGNARHVLDPRSQSSHLRVYGPERALEHTAAVYEAPGRYDITFDVDFTALGCIAEAHGLAVHFFGHQSALERPPIDLWSRQSQALLIPQRAAEGLSDPMQQLLHAHDLVQRFRQDSFRLMVLGAAEAPFPTERFGASDPWQGGRGLATLRPDVTPEMLREALEPTGAMLSQVEHYLHAGGDPLTDICDRRLYPQRQALLEVLEERGWLAEPGEIAAHRSR